MRLLMDDRMRRARACCLVILGVLGGCQARPPVEALPEVSRTMESIGRRLGGSLSESKLTVLASRGPELLSSLTSSERDALGRGYLRFHVSAPVEVEVAAPCSSVPFWLRDQGFSSCELELKSAETRWSVFRKSFAAGWIGLGVNGLGRTPPEHYVVFLRSPDGQPPLSRQAIELAAAIGDWQIALAQTGVRPAQDAGEPFAEIPPELAGAILLQPMRANRHSILLASGRVWKTRVPSGAHPDQVTIAYGADPGSELVWSWRTEPDIQGTALRIVPARYEAAESDSHPRNDIQGAWTITGSSTLIQSPNLLNDPTIRRHVVTASGLERDTTYLYSLGDGTPEGWGPWRTAKTARTRPGRIEFLYMGDAQTGLENWGRRLVTAYRRHPGLEFILLAGDLVDRGNERTNWDHFFLRAEEIFERIPIMPCAGNHEYLDRGPRLYRAFFPLPRNGPSGIEPGLVYKFEAGGAFFAILDSTLAVSDSRQAQKQAEWLDAALAETHAAWKLVMFHHPVYPSHASRDNPELRRFLVPIFDKHHVAMVLQGHDHAYLRTYPMRADCPVSSPEQGTIYVVSVAGDKYYDQAPYPYTEVGIARTSTYQTIEIDDVEKRLTYRAWNDEGEVVDRLDIKKPKSEIRRRAEFARREAAAAR